LLAKAQSFFLLLFVAFENGTNKKMDHSIAPIVVEILALRQGNSAFGLLRSSQ
jgi:hypothetical protein